MEVAGIEGDKAAVDANSCGPDLQICDELCDAGERSAAASLTSSTRGDREEQHRTSALQPGGPGAQSNRAHGADLHSTPSRILSIAALR